MCTQIYDLKLKKKQKKKKKNVTVIIKLSKVAKPEPTVRLLPEVLL